MPKLKCSKYKAKLVAVLGVVIFSCLFLGCGAQATEPVKFSYSKFMEPDAIYWPGYFWLWNGPLEKKVLAEQLRDMREHDARSVCVLPMPNEFRPIKLNNQMEPGYLSKEFFERVKVAVKEAKRLGMNWWLYDEGGWPSGEACGQVTKGRPDFIESFMEFKEGQGWEIAKGKRKRVDRLNPKATQRFIELTHEGYRAAVREHFGETIRFAFTDEPKGGLVLSPPGKQIPWTEGFGDYFEKMFGYRIEDHLDAFERAPDEMSREKVRIRLDFFDCWSQRFVDSYFRPIQRWCHKNGLRSSGHLDKDDTTLGSMIFNGNILRVLRAEDLPGVDVISQQLFPGKPNGNFPLFAATAAHQIGSPYAFTESFAAYGNGLTLEQMKWITDYQYVRGINLTVIGMYPLSTREHLMAGVRPYFGPVNPLWDYTDIYHGYVARLGYALSCGEPFIETGVYFPVRDMWAPARDLWKPNISNEVDEGYESLVERLLQNQCSFDLVDDDVLGAGPVREGTLVAGPMRYRSIVMGPCAWLKKESTKKLAKFIRSGGELFCLRQWPGTDGDNGQMLRSILDEESKKRVHILNSTEEIASKIRPLVRLQPRCDSIRVTARKLQNGSIYFLWNEGEEAFEGSASFSESGRVCELQATTGKIFSLHKTTTREKESFVSLSLGPGESKLLIFDSIVARKEPVWNEVTTFRLSDGWQGKCLKQFDVGEHDYEIRKVQGQWQPIELGSWKEKFGEDFSGDIVYRTTLIIRKDLEGLRLKLDMGMVEYAARVYVNGVEAGHIAWAPWEVTIPGKLQAGKLDVEIVVTNTLANVLTSKRVRDDWENRTGPGWPGGYDARAAKLEEGSRGGGLYGPVILKVGYWEQPEQ